jgi:hypothetical protein
MSHSVQRHLVTCVAIVINDMWEERPVMFFLQIPVIKIGVVSGPVKISPKVNGGVQHLHYYGKVRLEVWQKDQHGAQCSHH